MGYPMLKQRINRAGPKLGKLIECGQHHLTTGADGTFKFHPAFQNADDETRKTLCLTRYDLEEWRDFYFICRGKPAMPFNNVLKPMLDIINCMPLDQFQCSENKDEQRIVDGNWMLHAGNYMDMLHIKEGIHTGEGGLEGALLMDSYVTEFFTDKPYHNPFMTLQWAYAKNPDDGFDPKFLPERFRDPSHPERRVFALWFFQFPNITWNFYPWGLSVNIYMPIPEDVNHTEFFWFHYVLDRKKYSERSTRWLSQLVDTEDTDAISLVNRTLRGHARPWQRSIFGEEKERGPHWFHRMVYKTMFLPNFF
jgi:choline monooxygenase